MAEDADLATFNQRDIKKPTQSNFLKRKMGTDTLYMPH